MSNNKQANMLDDSQEYYNDDEIQYIDKFKAMAKNQLDASS
jgi:hypothetical protein